MSVMSSLRRAVYGYPSAKENKRLYFQREREKRIAIHRRAQAILVREIAKKEAGTHRA